MSSPRTVIVKGAGGGSAGILLVLIAVVGLVALFSGNLDRLINAIAGKQGGDPGLGAAEPTQEVGAASTQTRIPTPPVSGANAVAGAK
jgi:hypothetical protein